MSPAECTLPMRDDTHSVAGQLDLNIAAISNSTMKEWHHRPLPIPDSHHFFKKSDPNNFVVSKSDLKCRISSRTAATTHESSK